jgi:hypothetical protein
MLMTTRRLVLTVELSSRFEQAQLTAAIRTKHVCPSALSILLTRC